LDGVQVVPAVPVQSEFCSHTVKFGAAHVVAHAVPPKPVHSAHVTPHEVAVVGAVAVPQQIGPPVAPTQSMASSHCQLMEPVTGHAVPAGTHVEGVPAVEGVSQHVWPAAHVWVVPPSAALNGQ
jgi:hypothetical protein